VEINNEFFAQLNEKTPEVKFRSKVGGSVKKNRNEMLSIVFEKETPRANQLDFITDTLPY